MGAFALRGYYAILDLTEAALAAGGQDHALDRARALLAAHPCCLQLRAKGAPAIAMQAISARLAPLCRAAGVPFCVNDRLDVALAVGADIVHLGQEDLPLADARQVLATAPGGSRLLIGVSTHNLAQAVAAVEGGADYIGFGPVFPTTSKDRPDPVVGIESLRQVCERVAIPVVAIGGITRQRVALVVAAGANAAAVIADVDRAPDRTAAGRQVADAFRPEWAAS